MNIDNGQVRYINKFQILCDSNTEKEKLKNKSQQSALKQLMEEDDETENSTRELSNLISKIEELKDPFLRESALFDLSKKREQYPELAFYLYYSPGILAIL
jgi:hypothetical protein